MALHSGTSLDIIDELLSTLDLVLLMTVNPGAGGQAFIEDMLGKIARLRGTLDERGLGAELEVDGGITKDVAPGVAQAGARVMVAGSAVFNSGESVAVSMGKLRASLP